MEFNSKLVEKFLDGTASHEEAERVLNWFQTKKGEKYLENRFNKDAFDFGFPAEALDTQFPHFKHENIKHQDSSRSKNLYKRASVWAVAASIAFLIAVLSLLYMYGGEQTTEETLHTSVYNTSIDEHRIITLKDGTRIRLNENSLIEIPDFNKADSRTVNLKGEAFFEVAHDESKPFIVKSEHGIVQVLGTAFNVRTSDTAGNLFIVAVSEGKVSFTNNEQTPSEQSQILTKNQIGLLNTETSEITTENMNVRNYLTWMHGRVVYDKTPFPTVLKQLSHIYQIENKITHEELTNLILTADFSERSLENVIETIAHSLDITAEIDGKTVTWSVNQE